MLTINGRPIAFHEYRRRRWRRPEALIPWAVLMTAAAGFWLLTQMASATIRAALAPERTGSRKGVVPAPTPDAVGPHRPHGRISLAYLIYKTLCLLIAAFFLLVLGILGAFVYLIN